MKGFIALLEKCLPFFFPFGLIFILLGMRGINTHLMLPLQALILFYGFLALFLKTGNDGFKILVFLYILYSLLSIILVFLGNGMMDGYLKDARVVILPIFTVFIGMCNNSNKLYRIFVYTVVFTMIIGIYLYFVKPAWFIQILVEKFNDSWYSTGNATEDNIMSGELGWASRFAAIYDTPYGVSYFGTFALCLLTIDLFKNEDNRLIQKRWIQIVSYIILAISAVLCQNRVAIVYLALLIAFGMYYSYKHKRQERKLFLSLIIGIFIIGAVVFVRYGNNDFVGMIKDTLKERFVDTQENGLHNSSRDYQIEVTINSWNNYVFGEGLGSRGGVARSKGKPGVTDNGYIKLLVEQGAFGFLFLLLIFLKSMIRALKIRKVLYAELFMLGYVLFAMIGANPLGMEYDYMIIMWFAMGHIWNNRYIEECRLTKNYL